MAVLWTFRGCGTTQAAEWGRRCFINCQYSNRCSGVGPSSGESLVRLRYGTERKLKKLQNIVCDICIFHFISQGSEAEATLFGRAINNYPATE